MENENPKVGRVQHVPKSSSDRLLTKFAEVGSESKPKVPGKKMQLRLKTSTASAAPLAERNSLLPVSRKPVNLVRRFGGVGKCKRRLRELKTKSIVAALEKTWRSGVEGASRVLMEKHYNRHKRLISDFY
ncbi:hypothetical protein F511_41306 [Dorcoceras hygrometricum]|uniref:Uncharacterized protein n=1 Tax=Dorcoceras hygrometricum TaxID=472368 RepID=A0A2Z6ZZL9_9LAMI|nr:hypothetical protein F511_41306 [Dorcoceras hygrometricum]